MGYANYVGRVGALAVALGIGAAVASTAGIAWAQDGVDPGLSDSPSVDAPIDTPGDPAPGDPAPGENPGGGGGDPGPADPPSQPVVETQPEETGTTGLTTTTGGRSPRVTISSSGGAHASRVVRQSHVEAASPAEESHRQVPQEQPAAFTRAAAPMAMDMPDMDPGMPDMDPGMPGMTGKSMDHMKFVPISSPGEVVSLSPRTEAEEMMMNKRLFATLMPGMFVDPDTNKYNDLSDFLFHMTDVDMMDMPGMDMPDMDHMKHMEFVAISSPGELFAGSRTMMSEMMLNKRLAATLMPGMFLETMRMDDGSEMVVYNDLSDYLWNMEDMDEHMMNMNMMSMGSMGECEGGMDMSGMAGMDMGCDSMDHSITPMMLVTAHGEVKTPETMGHAGHDMGSMPAEAMPAGHDMSTMPAESMPPGHDMSTMPAESMPPGHDMSDMPGHDMSDMPPPAVIPDDDTTPPNVALGSDPVHNDGDVRFAQHMVPHHSQAVEMIDIILAKPDLDPRVRDLALKIKADEVPEINAMKGWLKLWGNPAMLPNPHGTHGILSPAEIAQLKAAPGPAASILFLKEMISHHEGAIAASEVQIGEGKNRPALALAESIVDQQKADIVLMKSYLASAGQPAAVPAPTPAPAGGIGAHAGHTGI